MDFELAALAVVVNAGGIWIRAEAWRRLVRRAAGGAAARSRDTLVAYAVGLLGNIVLPVRAGEAARVGVLARRLGSVSGSMAMIAGSVVAHRLLDAVPLALLMLLVAAAPGAGAIGLVPAVALAIGVVFLMALATTAARRKPRRPPRTRAGIFVASTREGVVGLGDGSTAVWALTLQTVAWTAQLVVVWLSMHAFGLTPSLGVAALLLVAINVAVAIPFLPGGAGLFQAATALSLAATGVGAATGIAFGVGLQAIEVLTTLLVGVPLAAGEGIALTRLLPTLRRRPPAHPPVE